MITHTREIAFTAPPNGYICVALPALVQGVLNRLTIMSRDTERQQTQFQLFTRRGACRAAYDYNVAGGNLSRGYAAGAVLGQLRLLVDPTAAVAIGDVIQVKNSTNEDLNTSHTVLNTYLNAADSRLELTIASAVAASEDGDPYAIWQGTPFWPAFQLQSPLLYRLLATQTVPANTGQLLLSNINLAYENRDNISQYDNRQRAALYLEFDAGGDDQLPETSWAVSITTIDQFQA